MKIVAVITIRRIIKYWLFGLIPITKVIGTLSREMEVNGTPQSHRYFYFKLPFHFRNQESPEEVLDIPILCYYVGDELSEGPVLCKFEQAVYPVFSGDKIPLCEYHEIRFIQALQKAGFEPDFKIKQVLSGYGIDLDPDIKSNKPVPF